MKKTTPIAIGGRLFHIEEDGFDMLKAYLASLHTYFARDTARDEIIADIEARIAERFAEILATQKLESVSASHVAELMDSIGKPEDFGDGAERGTGSTAPAGTQPKKLFRDPEKGLLAGVASGLAAYFRIDPTIVRILFIVGTILWGTAIVVYVVLWLVLPRAKSAADKLEMRGDPVTLDSVAVVLRNRVDGNAVRSGVGRVLAAPFLFVRRILEALAGVLRMFFGFLIPLARRIIAVGFIVSAAVALFLVSFGMVLALGKFPNSYLDDTFLNFLSDIPYHTLVLAAAVSLLIPAIFVFVAGISIFRQRRVFAPAAGFALAGVWFVALVTAGVLGVRSGMQWQTFEQTQPGYEPVTVAFAPGSLSSVEMREGWAYIVAAEGAKTSVTFEGRKKDVDRFAYTVTNGVLKITPKADAPRCVLCDRQGVHITITAPNIDAIDFSAAQNYWDARVIRRERRPARDGGTDPAGARAGASEP